MVKKISNELSQRLNAIGAGYGFRNVGLEFSAFKDLKIKWVRGLDWMNISVSDYLDGAPDDVLCELVETLADRMRNGTDEGYREKVRTYIDGLHTTDKRAVFLKRHGCTEMYGAYALAVRDAEAVSGIARHPLVDIGHSSKLREMKSSVTFRVVLLPYDAVVDADVLRATQEIGKGFPKAVPPSGTPVWHVRRKGEGTWTAVGNTRELVEGFWCDDMHDEAVGLWRHMVDDDPLGAMDDLLASGCGTRTAYLKLLAEACIDLAGLNGEYRFRRQRVVHEARLMVPGEVE